MAPPRKEEEQQEEKPKSRPRVLRATEVGGADSSKSVTLAVPGDYPEDYEQESNIWRQGYDHAARIGNPVKACIIYANNFQGEDLSDSAIQAEIERLERIRDGRGSN